MVFLQTIGVATSLSLDQDVNFALDDRGPYDKTQFKADWNVSQPSSQSSHFTINQNPEFLDQNVFTVTCLANQVGGSSGMAFVAPLGGKAECLDLQYVIQFPEDIDFGKGFKMPGLTSYPDSPSGCIDNDSFDGFSARFMGRADKAPEGKALLEGYIYNPDKVEDCGDYYSTNPPFYLEGGKNYTIKEQVCLGDPGERNGYILAWVDGSQVLTISNILLRRSPSIFIDGIHMSFFYGGSTTDWAPKTNQNISFANFTIVTPSQEESDGVGMTSLQNTRQTGSGYLRKRF